MKNNTKKKPLPTKEELLKFGEFFSNDDAGHPTYFYDHFLYGIVDDKILKVRIK